jgi:hypothetical protein
MRVVFRSLLAVTSAVCSVAWVSSCALNDHGLGGIDASTGRVAFDGGSAGAHGAAGTQGLAGTQGTAGTTSPATGTAGVTSPAGTAGTEAAGTSGGDTAGVGASGSAGATTTGTAGDAMTGDAGAPFVVDAGVDLGSSDAADTAAGGTSGAAGSMAPPEPGCSDGTREGYLDMKKYPGIAACSGGWAEPGLDSEASHTPECARRAGNSGDKVDGHGCSIADLCAAGWHVCESTHEVSLLVTACTDAFSPSAAKPVFFVTRQRAIGLTCTANSQTEGGTNNIYGCGNVGSFADKSCTPLDHMLRDSDCANQPPWSCSDNSQDEYLVVTKLGSSRGGALCCKD